MTRYSIKFSDGSHGALLSKEDATRALERIDSDRRPFCELTTWTEGTRESIVAEWLREKARELNFAAMAATTAGSRRLLGDKVYSLLDELLRIAPEEPGAADTLRPPRSEQKTIDEEPARAKLCEGYGVPLVDVSDCRNYDGVTKTVEREARRAVMRELLSQDDTPETAEEDGDDGSPDVTH